MAYVVSLVLVSNYISCSELPFGTASFINKLDDEHFILSNSGIDS